VRRGLGRRSFELRLLGPVEAFLDGEVVPLGGRRQRALLALLLVARGQPLATGELADELWQGRPPQGFQKTLRSYVSRLRRTLGDHVALVGGGAAYSLQVPSEAVDVTRFERLVQEGADALARDAVGRAADRYSEALALWRGPALAGVSDDGTLRLEAQRLEELRLAALEQRIEAELGLGRSDGLVEELEALVERHPYRERLWRHLMLALYRADRQADALEAYRRARTLLAEELGLEPSEQLKELERAILRHEVPRVEPPEQRHNLPAPVTSFVGRATELAEVGSLIAQSRLVTLTGVGGVGKTRLALEVAALALLDRPDGVYFCDLAQVTEASLVPRAVARVFGIHERARVDLSETLVNRLREADLLLLLDNCEHLREACSRLATTLLSACPQVRLLVTSRESLGTAGEVDYPVPPLAAHDSVSLFLARARTVRPHLRLDDAARAAAGSICADLDGLPLAIELAAARAKALSLEEIAARVGDRFRFLVSWRRLTPARHQTLREAMDWSYALLSEEEQRLLARLSVFVGGFTRAAAASVCLDGDAERALELIERLVDASLVIPEEHEGETRYRLLETVRQYAATRLAEHGERAEIEERHASYLLAFVQSTRASQHDDLQRWVRRVEYERGNLGGALAWYRDAGDGETLLALVASVWRFWWISGDLTEGRAWLEAGLAGAGDADPILRAEGLEGAAGLAWAQGDVDRARELAERALPLFAAAGDVRGEQGSLILLGHVALDSGEFRAAESLFERSRRLARERGPSSNIAVCTHNLGSVAYGERAFERAAQLYAEARSLYQANGDEYGVALCELYSGLVAAEAGRTDDAAACVARAMPVFREMRFLQYAAQCLDCAAAVARARGAAAEAARLLAAGGALRERTGQAPTVASSLRDRELAAARAGLGEERFAAACAEGAALAEADALDRALAVVTG